MLTYFSTLLLVRLKQLGVVSRAADLVLDADARLVMPDHWRLDWSVCRSPAGRGADTSASNLG